MCPTTIEFLQSGASLVLTDRRFETTQVFLEGMDLTYFFAALPLVLDATSCDKLDCYFQRYLNIVEQRCVSFVLDTPTWQANPNCGKKLGYSREVLVDINRCAVAQA